MAQLVDSSVFIALERQGLRLSALTGTAPDEPIALASITASELLTAVHRADSPARRLRREAFVEAILEATPVLPSELECGMIVEQDVIADQGVLLLCRGQEVTPAVRAHLRRFHLAGALPGPLLVSSGSAGRRPDGVT